MTHNERLQRWHHHRSYARDAFQHGAHGTGWYNLFLAEELITGAPKASPKQQEQRQLASMLWRLEGLRGQLKVLVWKLNRLQHNSPSMVQAYHDCQTGLACAKNAADRVRNRMKFL